MPWYATEIEYHCVDVEVTIFFLIWYSRVFELSGVNKTNGPDFDFEISMEKSYPRS